MREGYLQLGGRRTWYRTYGEATDLPALLMLHGGPGGASPNDVPFVESIARDRLVVQYDQLESGRSQRLGDASVLLAEHFIAELDAVRAELGLTDVHLWGQSWGGMLAMEYALTHPTGLASIVNASGPHSCVLHLLGAAKHREELPHKNERALERCERTILRRGSRRLKAGDGPSSAKLAKQAATQEKLSAYSTSRGLQAVARAASYVPPLRRVAYQFVGLVFNTRHVIRTSPIPAGAIAQQAGANFAVYEHMWGPSEFFATGPLRDFDLTDRLHQIGVPMLVTSGAHESYGPEYVEQLVARVPDVQWELFDDAAHCSEFEAPERYTQVLRDFLTKIDARRPAAPGS
jgi:pimeloyl-ACP methyl ester carboxylesterase